MADDEIAQIRAARLAQLKQGGGPPQGADSNDEQQRRNQESEQRASLLSQIVEPQALDRLNRIRMVKESRATNVENRLIMLARSGQLRAKVTEEQLKELLGSLSEQESSTAPEKVKVVRMGGKGAWDDDDLDDLLEGS